MLRSILTTTTVIAALMVSAPECRAKILKKKSHHEVAEPAFKAPENVYCQESAGMLMYETRLRVVWEGVGAVLSMDGLSATQFLSYARQVLPYPSPEQEAGLEATGALIVGVYPLHQLAEVHLVMTNGCAQEFVIGLTPKAFFEILKAHFSPPKNEQSV